MSFLYKLVTRRLGVGFSIRVRSAWLAVDHLSVYAGVRDTWEASWSPEDGVLWDATGDRKGPENAAA